ncbi:glycosyl hydrolase family 3 N terminal domain-containing protein [Lipomyces oligophaga]|uniref:glycosyl hydrolase family 3 N terminal domain-containing protein n=1 Tax=Lipomyces oligophaga TaxID=45792 RepID=UPI0034CD5B6C
MILTPSLALIITGVLVATLTGRTHSARIYSNSTQKLESFPSPIGGRLSSQTELDLAWADAYEQAWDLVSQMTLLEKVNLTSGTGWEMGPCVGNTGEIPRLNFPSLCLQDGPLGIRFTELNSVFPAGLATGATWNKALMYTRGQALGQEFKAKGINVLLGPSMGPLGRAPEGGRNWEGFGTDPYLQGIGAYETVQGIQDVGVVATAKHFLLNEQEHFRQAAESSGFGYSDPMAYSGNTDGRALREIYAWPFAEAIRAGAGAVMCAYNAVNDTQACENSYLLNHILKDELGFQGYVMSDWLAQRSGVNSVIAGMDMSMPGDGESWADGIPFLAANLTLAALNGSIPLWRIDDMAVRILAAHYLVKQNPRNYTKPNFSSWTLVDNDDLYPGSPSKTPYGLVNQHVDARSSLSRRVTRQIATESMVLVKNQNSYLPLKSVKRMSIIGSAAGPFSLGPNGCENRGCNNGTLATGWGSGSVNYAYLATPFEVINMRAFSEGFGIDYSFDDYDLDSATVLAEASDVAIVFVTSDSGEGFLTVEDNLGDRNDLDLWHNGDELITTVASSNNNTIVVIESVGGVNMEAWIDNENITAVLYALVPGQDIGFGISDVLFGDANPSGRLPFTVARNKSDYPATVEYTMTSRQPQLNFSEGIFIDYRHFDRESIEPRYEFGFGMSYTTFEISNFSVELSSDANTDLEAPLPGNYSNPTLLNSSLPNATDTVYPDDIPRYKKFIYPYLTSSEADGIKYDEDAYPYPSGYNTTQKSVPHPAGGASGGNPALFDYLVNATAQVGNTGNLSGAEVVQLYLSYPDLLNVEFPVKSLRGFEKISLQPNETSTVQFWLTRKDLSYFDVVRDNWVLPRGNFSVYIGNSSRSNALAGRFSID